MLAQRASILSCLTVTLLMIPGRLLFHDFVPIASNQ